MNIQIMSDLHLELHRDFGEEFFKNLKPENIDLLILAGDISTSHPQSQLQVKLRRFCEIYNEVVFVAGNHDYWGDRPEITESKLRQMPDLRDNFHWLENECLEIEGVKICGSTLWFPRNTQITESTKTNDFTEIKNFDPWVYERNRISCNFLRQEAPTADIVVTHYCPTFRGVDRRHRNNPNNVMFYTDLEQLIRSAKPRYWIYGHAHEPAGFHLGETYLINNAFGYPHALCANYNSNMVIEIERKTS